MHSIVTCGLLALALAACIAPPAPAADRWLVLRAPIAYDGDTIYVTAANVAPELAEMSVRIRGIDTPEIRGDCPAEKAMALEARDYVRNLLSNGYPVEFTGLAWDKYGGRILATVDVNGHDLGSMLIAEGLARPYDGGKRQSWC